jgi:rSAM/selenodomain-associated transferase 1
VTAALAVIAKAPRPGAVKTRLCPPCSASQAAALAEAALRDTLCAVVRTPASRHIVILDGEPGDWLPDDVDIVPQRGVGLGRRLAAAFADVGEPLLIIGMDTPQVDPATLAAGLAALDRHDAVLGPALDGGYWAIGLRTPESRALDGVPMSAPVTCTAQRQRLRSLGLSVAELPLLRDVDDIADVGPVAALAPGSRFAAAAARLSAA